MKSLTKIEDQVTKFKAEHMNVALYEADTNFGILENSINGITSYNYIRLDNQLIKNTIPSNRVVYFNGSEWDIMSEFIPAGELMPAYPLGITQGSSVVYLMGRIKNVVSSLIDNGIIEVGKPYFLTGSGKITLEQPSISIHVGTFLSQTEFLMNVQFMTYSHQHRRAQLDSSKWVDMTDYILYPIAYLDELPLPYRGLTMVINGKYMPSYDNYTVDTEGIKVLNNDYMRTLLDTVNVYGYLSSVDTIVETFWSEPKTLTTPGVMSLSAGTPNITLENRIDSQSSEVGDLIIKNIPIVEVSTSGSVVKDISVGEDGTLIVQKTNVVESLIGGANTSVSSATGNVTIISNSNKVQEVVSSDIFLRGALSKQYSGTINTYIEYTYQRATSAIFKFYIPYNFVESKEVELYASSFGSLETITSVSVSMRYSNPTVITDGYISGTLEIPVTGINKISKNLLVKIPGIKANSWLYVQIERFTDATYLGNLGIIDLISKIWIS